MQHVNISPASIIMNFVRFSVSLILAAEQITMATSVFVLVTQISMGRCAIIYSILKKYSYFSWQDAKRDSLSKTCTLKFLVGIVFLGVVDGNGYFSMLIDAITTY
jgi:hypothetical protein